MSNFKKMIQQAQKMQVELQKTQDQLASLEFPYSSNGVTVVAKGDMSIKSITLNPEVVQAIAAKPGDADALQDLQDLLLVAVNGAVTHARKEVEGRMSAITGGLNIPGLM